MFRKSCIWHASDRDLGQSICEFSLPRKAFNLWARQSLLDSRVKDSSTKKGGVMLGGVLSLKHRMFRQPSATSLLCTVLGLLQHVGENPKQQRSLRVYT